MLFTVKYYIKAAAYVHFFDFSGRLLYETGLCAAVVQLLAAYTMQSMYAEIQHPYVLYMSSHTVNSIKKSLLQATIRERLMCMHAVAKVRLLFESGFYSRVAFIHGFTVNVG